jgi:prophage regulatory protein
MKLLKLPQVGEITQLSTATIYRLISVGKFPKQIKLSERTSRWLESEVMDYINKKIEARDK